MSANDRGPAFPRTGDCVAPENERFDLNGMSLRDYFAGQALIGLVAHTAFSSYGDLAALAYQQADCMLAERERKP